MATDESTVTEIVIYQKGVTSKNHQKISAALIKLLAKRAARGGAIR